MILLNEELIRGLGLQDRPETVRCPRCGQTLAPGQSFCPECGTPVAREQEPKSKN